MLFYHKTDMETNWRICRFFTAVFVHSDGSVFGELGMVILDKKLSKIWHRFFAHLCQKET